MITLIITIYNQPDTLSCIINALNQQTDKQFDVIVADDGSSSTNVDQYKALLANASFVHQWVWQDDCGFRAAMIRNKACANAKGNYLVFLDGDCIPRRDFIQRHRTLAQAGYFVAGNRVLLSQTFTEQVVAQQCDVLNLSPVDFLNLKRQGAINRLLPLISLPLGSLRCCSANRWQGVQTCNLGVWKNDFLAVNGFDEAFQGWGYEDSDLVVRLQHAGVKHKSGKFAIPVFHCWHQENDRRFEQENWQRFQTRMQQNMQWVKQGVDRYL